MTLHEDTIASVELEPVEVRFLCRVIPMVDDEQEGMDERQLGGFERSYVYDMLEEALERELLGDEGVKLLSEIQGKI